MHKYTEKTFFGKKKIPAKKWHFYNLFLALGVDDTRMDLFDEGSNRTVPSTPLQVSPPGKQFMS